MTANAAAELIHQTLLAAWWVSLPLLVVGFIAGIVVSLVQIVTSIQDAGFGAVPRLGAFLGALLIFLPWMMAKLMTFTIALFSDFSRYAR
jgi:flagellar biosynthesis protein FliQ